MKFYSEFLMPKFYDRLLKNDKFEGRRKVLVKKAKGKILEIGIGTGLNLPFYNEEVKEITGIDSNLGMFNELRKKRGKTRVRVNFKEGSVSSLPFKDNSFDTVLSTLVLCSLSQLEKSLVEIHRVLKPNGVFLFLDHGLSCDPKIKFRQKILNPFQKIIGDGCQLVVPIKLKIEESPLELVSIKEDYISSMPKTHGFLYEGVAKKI